MEKFHLTCNLSCGIFGDDVSLQRKSPLPAHEWAVTVCTYKHTYILLLLLLLPINQFLLLCFKGKENGIPKSTAVLKSLWKDLDTIIGQLK